MCQACTTAEQEDPRSAAFESGCISCEARILAGTGARDVRDGQRTAAYSHALRVMFGSRAEQGAVLVDEWAARQRQNDNRVVT